LTRGFNRPKTSRAKLDDAALEKLRALLHQSPRLFGQPTGVWTLALAAEVSLRLPVRGASVYSRKCCLTMH
jgi:hypothetical protein